MPTHSEKKRTEFSLASAAENVDLATALGSCDEGDESSGMSLVENLTLAGEYLSSIRYLNPRPPNSSAGRMAMHWTTSYTASQMLILSTMRRTINVWEGGLGHVWCCTTCCMIGRMVRMTGLMEFKPMMSRAIQQCTGSCVGTRSYSFSMTRLTRRSNRPLILYCKPGVPSTGG